MIFLLTGGITNKKYKYILKVCMTNKKFLQFGGESSIITLKNIKKEMLVVKYLLMFKINS